MKKFKYFIYYQYQTKKGGSGHGNMTASLDHLIKDIEDIKKVELEIKMHYKEFKNVVITNFIKL